MGSEAGEKNELPGRRVIGFLRGLWGRGRERMHKGRAFSDSKPIPDKCPAWLRLCGRSDYPGMYFDSELVKSFSLSLDFDFYYMYSDSREDS